MHDIKHLYTIAFVTRTGYCISSYITASEQWSLNITHIKAFDNFLAMNNIIVDLGYLPDIYNFL